MDRIELGLVAVAAIIPAALVGAVVGCLALGPLGFLVGGVLAGSAGALVASRCEPPLVHVEKSS